MNIDRRRFLCQGGLAAATLLAPAPTGAAPSPAPRSFLVRKPALHLGLVTYNLAKDWDLDTLIKNCEAAGFEGVELRTTHAHKVELNLTKAERAAVREKFQGSKVRLFGLGSTLDYHTPDPDKLRGDIAATREWLVLARDVGATGVKVRPNGLPQEVPVPKTLEQIGRALRELGDFARDHGQVLRLEVHGPGTAFVPHIKTILDIADHPAVGACWNSNATDLEGGWDRNFDLLQQRIIAVHMSDLCQEEYPYRKLLGRLNEAGYTGYCLAEIPESADPVRLMRYYRALWLAYQGLL